MVVKMLEEGKNSIVLPMYKIGDKRKLENYGGINLLHVIYKLYSKNLNKKLEEQTANFFWNVRMDSEKADLASNHYLE
jgi:hypothetical protein